MNLILAFETYRVITLMIGPLHIWGQNSYRELGGGLFMGGHGIYNYFHK